MKAIKHLRWLGVYTYLSQLLMMSMLGFVIFITLAEAALISKLHEYPMRVNLFDTTLFQALGRSSLTSALMMIGGNTLVVVVLPSRYLLNVFALALIVGVVLLSIVAFFLNLRDTHRVMAEAKQNELKIVREKMSAAFGELKTHGTIANPEILPSWLAYEKRLEQVSEWPFNTDTIRSLVVSVFVPMAAFVGRWLLGQF